jgi:hypothetical protein
MSIAMLLHGLRADNSKFMFTSTFGISMRKVSLSLEPGLQGRGETMAMQYYASEIAQELSANLRILAPGPRPGTAQDELTGSSAKAESFSQRSATRGHHNDSTGSS